MRKLSSLEERRLAILTSQSVQACLIEPTKTGLEKSILDATDAVRRYLLESSVHDYAVQRQGPEHKILIRAHLLSQDIIIPSQASLYRPVTKKGDPRIWFRKLPSFCEANDILALIAYDREIYILNLTKLPLEEIIEEKRSGPVLDLLGEINQEANTISNELLQKLKAINRAGPHETIMSVDASTAIGRTLEHLLGIAMNSSRTPDYKGIELKSFRSKRNNRKNLFAKTPNWKLSKLKSGAEILENFGYYNDDGRLQLYCTVSAKAPNPNGLQLKINLEEDILLETSNKEGLEDYLTWLMEDLRKALLKKHNETFWIEADSSFQEGVEFFDFTKVFHTRKPISSQFDLLLEQGFVTLDHTHKRLPSGREDNRGFLFKLNPTAVDMLFPPSKTYDLRG